MAPAVTDGVLKGSSSPAAAAAAADGSTNRAGQQKVANTALYVLIQRALVSHCPLVGYGKLCVSREKRRLTFFFV